MSETLVTVLYGFIAAVILSLGIICIFWPELAWKLEKLMRIEWKPEPTPIYLWSTRLLGIGLASAGIFFAVLIIQR